MESLVYAAKTNNMKAGGFRETFRLLRFKQGACRMCSWPQRGGRFLLIVSVLLVSSGCAEQLADVSGEVKIKIKTKDKAGKDLKESIENLESGQISFISQTGKKRVVETSIEKGKYKATGVPVGKVLVLITGVQGEVPPLETPGKDGKVKPKPKDTKIKLLSVYPVNKKYGDPKQSGLEYDVVLGEQTKDFTVEP